jgi:hypothetical protein
MRLAIILLALGLVTLGCVSEDVVCNKPYIRVGTGCCLDSDDNGICDSDEVPPRIEPIVKTCSGSGDDYCDNDTRYHDAVCDNGMWAYESETCEHGCEDGACMTAPSCSDGTGASACSNVTSTTNARQVRRRPLR